MSPSIIKEFNDDEFLSMIEIQNKMEMDSMLEKQVADFAEMTKSGFDGDYEDFLSAAQID